MDRFLPPPESPFQRGERSSFIGIATFKAKIPFSPRESISLQKTNADNHPIRPEPMKRLLMLLILLLLSFEQSVDAQRRKKPLDSLPDTVYLLNHYQKSPQ